MLIKRRQWPKNMISMTLLANFCCYTFPLSEQVVVMHLSHIARHHSVHINQIFCNETQKFWSTLYSDSHLIIREHVWYPGWCPPPTHTHYPASLWEFDGLSSEGCVGEPLGPLWTNIDCHQLLLEGSNAALPNVRLKPDLYGFRSVKTSYGRNLGRSPKSYGFLVSNMK